MLPGATLPAARYYVTPGRRRRSCAGPRPAPRRGARRKRPARDAEAGLAEVMAMPAIWKDAGGRLLELPGPGSGIVACGALPGAAAPEPAWTAGQLAAAGIAGEPGPVREGTGLGLASAVITPALLDEALAGVPARRPRKITPRLAMQVSLARALMPGTAAGTLRAMAQRPREADPGYDLPAASSLSDADSFLQVRPLVNLLAGLCGQVSAPSRCRACRRRTCRHRGRRTGTGPRSGCAPWRGRAGRGGTAAGTGCGCWPRTAPSATSPTPGAATARAAAGQSRNAAHFGRPASTGAPAAPQIRMTEVTDVWTRGAVAWAAGPCGTGERTLAAHLEPAYGPGDLDLADRGFPSREAVAAKIEAGKHFAWRISSSWTLRRSGRPLPDGTWKAKITWRGRTYKVRVIEYHIDQVLDLPPGHPLLTAPPPGPSVRVLDDGGDAEGRRAVPATARHHPRGSIRDRHHHHQPDGHHRLPGPRHRRTVRHALGQRARLPGRKADPGRRAAHHRGHPGRGLPDGRRHRRRAPGAADRRRRDRRGDRRRARQDQRHRAPRRGHRQHRRRAGRHAGALTAAIEITRRDITAHPLRFVTTWRPGRHYPRFTIKKVRTRKSNDVVPAATRLHLLPLPATPGSQQPNAPPAA